MAKFNVDKDMTLKIVGGVFTVAGTVIGMIASNKDNVKNTEKAVEKILNSKKEG